MPESQSAPQRHVLGSVLFLVAVHGCRHDPLQTQESLGTGEAQASAEVSSSTALPELDTAETGADSGANDDPKTCIEADRPRGGPGPIKLVLELAEPADGAEQPKWRHELLTLHDDGSIEKTAFSLDGSALGLDRLFEGFPEYAGHWRLLKRPVAEGEPLQMASIDLSALPEFHIKDPFRRAPEGYTIPEKQISSSYRPHWPRSLRGTFTDAQTGSLTRAEWLVDACAGEFVHYRRLWVSPPGHSQPWYSSALSTDSDDDRILINGDFDSDGVRDLYLSRLSWLTVEDDEDNPARAVPPTWRALTDFASRPETAGLLIARGHQVPRLAHHMALGKGTSLVVGLGEDDSPSRITQLWGFSLADDKIVAAEPLASIEALADMGDTSPWLGNFSVVANGSGVLFHNGFEPDPSRSDLWYLPIHADGPGQLQRLNAIDNNVATDQAFISEQGTRLFFKEIESAHAHPWVTIDLAGDPSLATMPVFQESELSELQINATYRVAGDTLEFWALDELGRRQLYGIEVHGSFPANAQVVGPELGADESLQSITKSRDNPDIVVSHKVVSLDAAAQERIYFSDMAGDDARALVVEKPQLRVHLGRSDATQRWQLLSWSDPDSPSPSYGLGLVDRAHPEAGVIELSADGRIQSYAAQFVSPHN